MDSKRLQDERLRLSKIIVQGKQVNELLESKAWGEVIEPLLDKMIKSILGEKKCDGNWLNGFLTDLKNENAEYYRGYAQFGIDFYNRVYRIANQVEGAEEHLAKLNKRSDRPMAEPMLDGSYAPQGEMIDGTS